MLLSTLNRVLKRGFLRNIAQSATVADYISKFRAKFEAEEIPEPENSLVNLMAYILQTRDLSIVEKQMNERLSSEQAELFEKLCLARLARMPVQYCIKEWDFRDLRGIQMRPPVFIPRPETEELVELILQSVDANKRLKFLEIGCGSGVISLALLKALPRAVGIAIDHSAMAVNLTNDNAQMFEVNERLDVIRHKIVDGSLPEELETERFDLLISNPPYVPTKELLKLDDEIKLYEDLRALDGGPDGLSIIKPILDIAQKHLKPSGHLWLEVHTEHPKKIQQLITERHPGLEFIAAYQDFNHKDRFVEIKKNE